jgi:hypothetical protein
MSYIIPRVEPAYHFVFVKIVVKWKAVLEEVEMEPITPV